VLECRNEGGLLFERVLRGREKADRTRNALSLLHRFKFLFTLPASIDRNLANQEYDTIINDYARINNLFGKTDLNVSYKLNYIFHLGFK
jgi:exocyst complex component 2